MTFIRSMCSNLDKHDVLKEFRKRCVAFLEDLETTECPSVPGFVQRRTRLVVQGISALIA